MNCPRGGTRKEKVGFELFVFKISPYLVQRIARGKQLRKSPDGRGCYLIIRLVRDLLVRPLAACWPAGLPDARLLRAGLRITFQGRHVYA